MLPMPYEQEGLAEYFYSFIGRQPPQTGPKRDMEIEIQRYSVGYDLVGGYKPLPATRSPGTRPTGTMQSTPW